MNQLWFVGFYKRDLSENMATPMMYISVITRLIQSYVKNIKTHNLLWKALLLHLNEIAVWICWSSDSTFNDFKDTIFAFRWNYQQFLVIFSYHMKCCKSHRKVPGGIYLSMSLNTWHLMRAFILRAYKSLVFTKVRRNNLLNLLVLQHLLSNEFIDQNSQYFNSRVVRNSCSIDQEHYSIMSNLPH